jgi:hypothetical protein
MAEQFSHEIQNSNDEVLTSDQLADSTNSRESVQSSTSSLKQVPMSYLQSTGS